jgi:hypothetical protein
MENNFIKMNVSPLKRKIMLMHWVPSYLTCTYINEVVYLQCIPTLTPRRYPYFDVVVGLVWSRDPKNYAGGSICYW